jgi:hypothetical protein
MIWRDMPLGYRLAVKTQENSDEMMKTSGTTEKRPVSFAVRVQAIRSKGQNPRLYISFPLALAAAIGMEPGEEVQWELLERGELHLLRPGAAAPAGTPSRKRSTPS